MAKATSFLATKKCGGNCSYGSPFEIHVFDGLNIHKISESDIELFIKKTRITTHAELKNHPQYPKKPTKLIDFLTLSALIHGKTNSIYVDDFERKLLATANTNNFYALIRKICLIPEQQIIQFFYRYPTSDSKVKLEDSIIYSSEIIDYQKKTSHLNKFNSIKIENESLVNTIINIKDTFEETNLIYIECLEIPQSKFFAVLKKFSNIKQLKLENIDIEQDNDQTNDELTLINLTNLSFKLVEINGKHLAKLLNAAIALETLVFSSSDFNITSDELSNLTKLKNLSLSSDDEIEFENLNGLLSKTPNLQSLTIKNGLIKDDITNCDANLLSLSRLTLKSCCLSYSILITLLQKMPNVEHITFIDVKVDISQNKEIESIQISEVMLDKLTYLRIENIEMNSPNLLVHLINQSKNLTVMHLVDDNMAFAEQIILSNALKSLDKLQKFKLQISKTSLTTIYKLLTKTPMLSELYLNNIEFIPTAATQKLLKQLTSNITMLDLSSSIFPTDFFSIFSSLTQLTYLNLTNTKGITFLPFNELNICKLNYLNVSYTNISHVNIINVLIKKVELKHLIHSFKLNNEQTKTLIQVAPNTTFTYNKQQQDMQLMYNKEQHRQNFNVYYQNTPSLNARKIFDSEIIYVNDYRLFIFDAVEITTTDIQLIKRHNAHQ